LAARRACRRVAINHGIAAARRGWDGGSRRGWRVAAAAPAHLRELHSPQAVPRRANDRLPRALPRRHRPRQRDGAPCGPRRGARRRVLGHRSCLSPALSPPLQRPLVWRRCYHRYCSGRWQRATGVRPAHWQRSWWAAHLVLRSPGGTRRRRDRLPRSPACPMSCWRPAARRARPGRALRRRPMVAGALHKLRKTHRRRRRAFQRHAAADIAPLNSGQQKARAERPSCNANATNAAARASAGKCFGARRIFRRLSSARLRFWVH
jgi:hypothetical protein